MKKLKKIFTVAIALLMLFTSVNAFANNQTHSNIFTDIENSEAIEEVARTGLMIGYEDGSFKPDGNISRAEFAAIVCRLLGIEKEAKKMKESAFADVPNNHWAVGLISKAADLKIISGYGNNKFGPSDNVLYEQAIKMLVCAEKGADRAEKLGGYPNGYISAAEELKFLDNIDYKPSDSVTRKNIAQILYNIIKNRDNAFLTASKDDLSIIVN